MSSIFYNSVIDDEMKAFGIKKDSLKCAATSVGRTYSPIALTKGTTFLDYNLPSNRCAYLYKYAPIHTDMVAKYCRKLIKRKEIKSIIRRKDRLQICCLGGGPGGDIVGLFKALATIPHYHKKIIEVTVLDICGGWRNSFKRVISNLISGKIKGVPETFVDASKFKFKLIEVNLLNTLPTNVAEIISNADIVCMVKFVSAIIGIPASISALKVIGEKLKTGAIVLFIDNFKGNVFKPFADISGQVGLKVALGPLHEVFNKKIGYVRALTSKEVKEQFGCLPLICTKVTVLGFIKSTEPCNNDFSNNIDVCPGKDANDDGWDTDNESDETPVKEILGCKNVPNAFCDKFSQTDAQCNVSTDVNTGTVQTNHLNSLIDSLCDLVNVLNQWQEKMGVRRHCCHCH